MPFTVADSFARLRSNLEITDIQTSVVSTRQQTIRRTVANGLAVVDDFLTGSYARSTMISPLSEADIDIFVCLDPSYFHRYNNANGGPAGLLDLAKQTIRRTYTTTPDISRNGQAVTIRFSDFVVDVVIGFHRNGGGYIIANSVNNFWLETDPKKHVEIFSEANKAHSGNLVPLIKMIKSWNKAHGSFFRSFHLEVLALEALKGVIITDFPSGLRFFFQKAATLVRGKNPDLAGYGDDIGRYITQATLGEASQKFQGAFNMAAAAEQYANRGQVRQAIEIWRHLLPNHFPAYG
ncbi:MULTISPECIES: CBASS oligonucleotide cyclase [unclassified Bradyrhizobium]|uniref:CBASS oligonucleotide cyclase n=1 Tax=unclassified Bradyrhizobium TaxID=2631580 RepID=UPI002479F585|nr:MULTISPECIES: CBASS oligonucleotide cyclase [unclassified Bradyrhizobium]WGR70284.1 nucleotidyltransferase [Bradyrhizobium sp. ISRA426]WGR82343.1 nucleotidyltransferase [Bradyrhizobium sp. ISRA430]WGR85528.1 nucleotidyltransferase [Bradyrhizobium sp. ISRA432]